jgi:CHASE3 domain sensor protein
MMHQWTFQKKVTVGFTVMVCLAAITASVAVYGLRVVVASKDRVITVNSQNLTNAARLNAAVGRRVDGFRGCLLVAEETFRNEMNAGTDDFVKIMRLLEQKVYTAEGKRMLNDIKEEYSAMASAQDRVIERRKTNTPTELLSRELQSGPLPHREKLAKTLDEFINWEQRLLQQGEDESTASVSFATDVVVWLAVTALFFAALTAFFLSRGLSRQIGSAVQHVQNSSAELQTSANQQASGAREAATAMNEVTTTMGELLVTSRQISESAQRVAHIAKETAGAARTGA